MASFSDRISSPRDRLLYCQQESYLASNQGPARALRRLRTPTTEGEGKGQACSYCGRDSLRSSRSMVVLQVFSVSYIGVIGGCCRPCRQDDTTRGSHRSYVLLQRHLQNRYATARLLRSLAISSEIRLIGPYAGTSSPHRCDMFNKISNS